MYIGKYYCNLKFSEWEIILLDSERFQYWYLAVSYSRHAGGERDKALIAYQPFTRRVEWVNDDLGFFYMDDSNDHLWTITSVYEPRKTNSIYESTKEQLRRIQKQYHSDFPISCNSPDDINGYPFGYLSPDGKIYLCSFRNHTKLARNIARSIYGEFDNDTESFILQEKGYVGLRGTSVTFEVEDGRITEEQQNVLTRIVHKVQSNAEKTNDDCTTFSDNVEWLFISNGYENRDK